MGRGPSREGGAPPLSQESRPRPRWAAVVSLREDGGAVSAGGEDQSVESPVDG